MVPWQPDSENLRNFAFRQEESRSNHGISPMSQFGASARENEQPATVPEQAFKPATVSLAQDISMPTGHRTKTVDKRVGEWGPKDGPDGSNMGYLQDNRCSNQLNHPHDQRKPTLDLRHPLNLCNRRIYVCLKVSIVCHQQMTNYTCKKACLQLGHSRSW